MMVFKKIVCAMAVAGIGLAGLASASAQDAAGAEGADKMDKKSQDKKIKIDKAPTKTAGKLKLKAFAGCKNDVKKHCADIEPGEGRVRACLGEHSANLDKKCTANMERYERRQSFKVACGEDVKAHCATVKPGKGAVAACLKAASISDACKTRFDPTMPAAQAKEADEIADEAAAELSAPAPEGDAAIEANP